ncbi:MAG: GTP-binding protein [Candidatus Thorarchaeota archaeon]
MNEIAKENSTIAIMTLGHIDHGKSTTLGHFLYLIGVIDQRTMDKLESESQELKMQSWKWAYILDSTNEERAGGITADIAFQPFQTTSGKKFMLIDGPGHRDFVKNAIKGAVQTDACILMVSAYPNDLKAGLKEGGVNDPGGQTREHAILGSVLGIQSVLVCINKMDMVNFSQDAFNAAVSQVKKLLKEIQSPWLKSLKDSDFVPISGISGDNLTERSAKMSWYKGPTFLEALEGLKPIERKNNLENIRFLVYDNYDFPGIGTLLYGRLIAGKINRDQSVISMPFDQEGTIKDIWDVNSESINEISAGEFGSLQIKGIDKEKMPPGSVICSENSLLHPATKIIARVLILETSGRPIIPGSSIILHVGLSHTAATIERIISIEREKKSRNKDKIMLAFGGELVSLEIYPEHPIIVEKYSEQPILGRLILRHSGQTIAVGVVTNFIT